MASNLDIHQSLRTDTIRLLHLSPPVCVDRFTPVSEVVEVMRERGVGAVLVKANGRLAGIFTGRDIITRVIGKDLAMEDSVERVMTPNPVVLSPDDLVVAAFNRMSRAGIRHVPVVDGEQRPSGIVSFRDIVHYLMGFFKDDLPE